MGVSTTSPRGRNAVVAALLALALGGAVGCDEPAPPRRDRRPRVTMEHAAGDGTPRDRLGLRGHASVTGNGVVETASREVRVAARAAGRIVAVRVAEGDFVAAGATLVELERQTEQAALAAAEAELAVAQAELARTLHGQRREDVQAARADAEAARVRQELSARLLERSRTLEASGYVARSEIDRARAQADADRLTAQGSDARRRAMATGSRREDIAAARARVAAAEARREQARAALDQLTVRAPIDGAVLRVEYRPGEFYSPSPDQPLLVLGDTRRLRVRAEVDERDLGRVGVGARAVVLADAFPDRPFPARVARMGQLVRARAEGQRTLEVVLDLDRWDALVPGQRVVISIEPPR